MQERQPSMFDGKDVGPDRVEQRLRREEEERRRVAQLPVQEQFAREKKKLTDALASLGDTVTKGEARKRAIRKNAINTAAREEGLLDDEERDGPRGSLL